MSKSIIYLGFNNPRIHKRGVENVIGIQAIAKADIKSYYIFFSDEDQHPFRWDGIICIPVLKNIIRFVKLNLLIWFLLKRNKGSIIHSHNFLMSFFLLRPTEIFTVHDGLYYLKRNFGAGYFLCLLYRLIERTVYKKSKFIHFISKFAVSQAFISKKQVKQKSIFIENSTPLERFYTISENEPKPANIQFLIVRSIEDRANIELILSVAKHFEKKGGGIDFEIVGKGPLYDKFIQQRNFESINNVCFHGYLDDKALASLYKKCFAVIVPAKYGEGFGLPIIEGYLFNKPVIASNVCAIPEIIISKEFLFENTENSLISCIDWLINSNSLNNFSDYYNANFSVRIIHNKYKNLYDRLI